MSYYNNVQADHQYQVCSLSTSVREQELLSLSALQWTKQTDARNGMNSHKRESKRDCFLSLFLISPVIQQTQTVTQRWKVREGVASVPRHDDFFLEKSTRHEAEISPHTRSACRPEQQVFLSLCFTRPHSHHLHTSPTAECNKCVTR